MREVKVKEYLKCTFSEDEVKEFAASLARETQELNEIQEEKTRIAADFKAKIEARTANTNVFARKINNGYEHRIVECVVKYHHPAEKQKTLIRLDTGEEVRTDKMNEEELQEELPLAKAGD